MKTKRAFINDSRSRVLRPGVNMPQKKSKFLLASYLCLAAHGVFCNTPVYAETNNPRLEPLQMADPFIYVEGDTFYGYGTTSKDGIEVYVSSDLRNWKNQGLALDKKDSYADSRFWAPEVYHVNGKYYMFYSADEHICVAKSDSPMGPFVQNEKKPIMEEKGIDTSLFIDEDGTPYLYFVRFSNGNVIWVAEMTDDLMGIKEDTMRECVKASEDWELKQERVVEGPSIIKYNGIYYLLYSANHFQSKDYSVGYATSESPLGPWKKNPDNPILHKNDGLLGTGHGAPFTMPDGSYKYVYHAHKDNETVSPRLTYIKDLEITGDGRISIKNTPIKCVLTK